MAKQSKSKITLIIILLAVGAVLGVKYFLGPEAMGSKEVIHPRVKGDAQAPLQIVEFIDFECPACANGAKLLKSFMEEHPEAVYLQMKYFPLGMHRHAIVSARYAECAARQNKFWPFHDLLIERQNNWKRLDDAAEAFNVIAKESQLDESKLTKCLEDDSVLDDIQKDKEEGQSMGVNSTPTYFINGTITVGTKQLTDAFNKYLADKIAPAQTAVGQTVE